MTDRRVILAVVIALGLLALVVVGGGIYLAANDKGLPGELIAIGSLAAGAVAGILAKTDSAPTPVQVVNQADAAVPVDPQPTDPTPTTTRARTRRTTGGT